MIATVTAITMVSSTASASGSTQMYFKEYWPLVIGSQFVVQVRLNTNGDHINAVEADFTYPQSILQFVSIDSASASAFQTETPGTTGGGGTVSIQRGVSGPQGPTGISGDLKVANVTFNVIGAGTANLAFQGSSTAELNGVNDLATMTNGQFIDDTWLSGGQVILPGGELISSNSWRFIMQTDGNLLVRNPQNVAVWATGTSRDANSRLVMQTDGNLVLRSASNAVLWQTHTSGNDGARLVLQTDGNLVIRARNNTAIWDRTAGILH